MSKNAHQSNGFSVKELLADKYLIKNSKNQINQSASTEYPSALEQAHVQLMFHDLWRQFDALGNEMIVTKAGRRMFPSWQIQLSGLVADEEYDLMIDFEQTQANRFRYSFHQSKWTIAGEAELCLPCRVYCHPDSPSNGKHWMQQTVQFDKLKITNNQFDSNGHVILNSMHSYEPRVLLVWRPKCASVAVASKYLTSRTFRFDHTKFYAVTAYQNHRVTQLKIACNPFAKGFRESELNTIIQRMSQN